MLMQIWKLDKPVSDGQDGSGLQLEKLGQLFQVVWYGFLSLGKFT